MTVEALPSEKPAEKPVASDDLAQPVVLVTGCSGLIGTRVCHDLAPQYRIVGLDRDPPRDDEVREDWFPCDLTSDESVRDAMAEVRARAGGKIASAIHLAAYYDFTGAPSGLYRDLTVEGTRRLLRELQAFEVEQFVFSSSLLAMRPVEAGQLLDEHSVMEAWWDYPRSKIEAERTIAEERGAIPAVILRLAGAYDEDGHSPPITQQIRRIYERRIESFFFPGNPHHGQSFVHLDDVVTCFRAVVDRRRALDAWEVFLIGEPDIVCYGEMQDILGEALHDREWPTIRVPAPLAKAVAWVKQKTPAADPFIQPWMIDIADAHRPISIERARARLGWHPRRRLADALPEMARRLTQDPVGWYERNGIPLPDSLPAHSPRA
jgi:nucleoside-diphosphate-sugar epimerase